MLDECLKSEKQQKKGRKEGWKEYSTKKKVDKNSRTENSNTCNQNLLDDLKSKIKMTEE